MPEHERTTHQPLIGVSPAYFISWYADRFTADQMAEGLDGLVRRTAEKGSFKTVHVQAGNRGHTEVGRPSSVGAVAPKAVPSGRSRTHHPRDRATGATPDPRRFAC